MSQGISDDINPASTSGTQLATILNTFKDAIASGFSGTTRPPNLQAGGYWIDTSDNPNKWLYKLYTGVADITIFTINLTTGTVSVSGVDGQFTLTKVSNDAVGPILAFIKKRISGSGQTSPADILGEMDFSCTDDTATQRISAKLKIISADTATSSAFGSYLAFELVNAAGSALGERARLQDGKFGVGTTTPTYELHAKGTLGVGAENEADTTTAAKITGRKKRATGSGQVLSGDSIVQFKGNSTDNAGTEIDSAFIIDAVAVENHSSTAHGTRADFKVKAATTTTLTTVFSILASGISSVLNAAFKSLVVGTSGTAATNVKVLRSGTGKLSIVLGNDATAEGSEPTTLAQLAGVVENFTSGTKPTNQTANKGRIIYVTDTNKYEYDTGSAWANLGGGALVVSSQLTLAGAGTISITGTDSRRKINIKSSAGEVTLAGIGAGVTDGDELKLEGQSAADVPTLPASGSNVLLNGDWSAFDGSMLCLTWNATRAKWVEDYRNAL